MSRDLGFKGINGASTTLGQYMSGKTAGQVFTGVAAVSDFGKDPKWSGHEMSTANTYGFGRLAWDPRAAHESGD